MSIHVTNAPRAVFISPQASAARGNQQAAAPARPRDTVSISPEARAAMEQQAVRAVSEVSEDQPVPESATSFPSFAVEFDKVTQRYDDAVRAHYAEDHEENLTYADPSVHIWDKYKNPDSPDFRSGLSEDERAWAYDHELDLLNGGKRFQLGNPFVFDTPPTLSTAAMEANQACREQLNEAIAHIFQKEGIEIPEGASFQLTVDASYTIRVTGLEDGELAASIEQALNAGENGKNLYEHLKITSPDGETLAVSYANGRLEPLAAQERLGEDALAEVRNQVGASCSHYSSAYNPHQGPLGEMSLPGMLEPTPAERECSYANIRLGVPELLAKERAGEFYQPSLEVHARYAAVDPDNKIARDTYASSYFQQVMDARKTIEDYYAAAHQENSSYPFEEGVQHIRDKYQNQDSAVFRFDLPPAQRAMFFHQELALLTGSPLTLRDPYALASTGGTLTAEAMHNKAMQAVLEKLDALLKGTENP